MPEKVRRRLPRRERERLIIEEAMRFFSEVGFEGQTRALAQRLGVTQPLLYRYFPDKDALIERVFSEVVGGSWDPNWETVLTDRSRPLAKRLTEFYVTYSRANFRYERVRLLMFASLKNHAAASSYLALIRERLFVPLVRELRAEAKLPEAPPIHEDEIACVAGLHGAIGYVVTRCGIDGKPAADELVARQVATFLNGAASTLSSLAATAQ
jgi:AcrR family transcriptional regulator